jgi:hypothetical protein
LKINQKIGSIDPEITHNKKGNVKGESQMLPYILAIVVGLSSLYLLTTAFIAPIATVKMIFSGVR